MAHSHSSHQHPKVSVANNNNNRPLNPIIQNFENAANGLMNGGRSDNNGYATSSSWQNEQTFNLDNFDLIEYMNADSSSPIDELNNFSPDDIEKQKMGAMYEQWQLDEIYHPEHDLITTTATSSDYAQVPTYVPSGITDTYMNDHNYPDYQHEDELQLQQGHLFRTSTAEGYSSHPHTLDTVAVVAPMPSTSQPHRVQVMPIPTTTLVKAEMVKQEPADQIDGTVDPNVGTVTFAGTSRASSVSSSVYTVSAPSSSTATFMPTKPPRKYRMKPEAEKLNPHYKIKRQKNNEAVRRSRTKAKSMQHEKELRLEFLEHEHQRMQQDLLDQASLITELKEANDALQLENRRLRRNCRCGAATAVSGKINKR